MSHFGLPSRTRSDAGLENVVVSRLMVDLQGRAKAVVLLEGQFITRELKGCGEMVILWYWDNFILFSIPWMMLNYWTQLDPGT